MPENTKHRIFWHNGYLFMHFYCFCLPPTYPTPSEWHLLVNLGCWIFQISRLTIIDLVCCKRFSKNMLVRYRVINNKGVLERPWTKWMVLIAISSTLKLQFTIKCWKVDFLTSNKTRSCQSSRERLRMLRALLPETPRPPQVQPELQKKTVFVKNYIFPGSLTGA
jgi:hypothetical protein